MTSETRFIIDWIGRMAHAHGGIVHDIETCKTWDWGQALCRERFGPDWMHHADFLEGERLGQPFQADVNLAKAWEEGAWPAWARVER